MDERLYQIQGEMLQLENLKRTLRDQEKTLDARAHYLGRQQTFPSSNIKGLKNSLMGNLPSFMQPGNVGGINEVTWPFYFNINMDLGTDPTISQNTYFRGSYQVDQEAAFIMSAISVTFNEDASGVSACRLAPLQVEFIDRQSTRRFNNAPMPLQMVGQNSRMSILPTPMFVYPNAFIDVVINGITSNEVDLIGSGSLQFSFFGNRVRTEDAGKVLSTIFAPNM